MTEKTYDAISEQILGVLSSKLPKELYYHGVHHTLYVLNAADMIAWEEGISKADHLLLRIAVLYHDIGFIYSNTNHEQSACDLVIRQLPGFGVTENQIEKICGMIMATKIPQSPKTKLEEIIADADLEYLGTDNFNSIANALYLELKHNNPSLTEKEWDKIQIAFIENHSYFTGFCKTNREPKKAENLRLLKEKFQQEY